MPSFWTSGLKDWERMSVVREAPECGVICDGSCRKLQLLWARSPPAHGWGLTAGMSLPWGEAGSRPWLLRSGTVPSVGRRRQLCAQHREGRA